MTGSSVSTFVYSEYLLFFYELIDELIDGFASN